jgi:hypothetical protein
MPSREPTRSTCAPPSADRVSASNCDTPAAFRVGPDAAASTTSDVSDLEFAKFYEGLEFGSVRRTLVA